MDTEKFIKQEKWLRNRQSGIGGSDIGAIMGVSPYNTAIDIYNSKIEEQLDLTETIVQRRGHFLEPFVAELYHEKTGHNVIPNGDISYRHPIEDFMMVTPDYWYTVPWEDLSKRYLLEIKTAVGRGAIKWYDGVPDYVLLQCQHQMFVCCQDKMDLAILIDDNFKYITLYRNDDIINNMLLAASDFWYGYVVPRIIPNPRTLSDYKSYYKLAIADSIIDCSDNIRNTIAEYHELKDLHKMQKELIEQTINAIEDKSFTIRSFMKDKEILQDGNVILATYKNTKNDQRRLSIK